MHVEELLGRSAKRHRGTIGQVGDEVHAGTNHISPDVEIGCRFPRLEK
jgi:hypothetical protein